MSGFRRVKGPPTHHYQRAERQQPVYERLREIARAKEMTRAKFAALSPAEKVATVRAGIVIGD